MQSALAEHPNDPTLLAAAERIASERPEEATVDGDPSGS